MTLEDAPRVGEVHVRAWQATYRSVMPDDYLDGLRAEDRADMWVLWVVAENVRARAFYEAERAGGSTAPPGWTVQGATVNEVRFGRDLPRPNGLDHR